MGRSNGGSVGVYIVDENSETMQADAIRDEFSERRMWFDYLSKLNDRVETSRRASQPTTWVLVGVAAAIIYRAVPQIPHYAAIPGFLLGTLIVFVLEADVFLLVLACLHSLVLYSAGSVRSGLMPEEHRGAQWLFTFQLLGTMFILISLHVYLAVFATVPKLVRLEVWVVGSFFLLNICGYTWEQAKRFSQARKLKFPVPLFIRGKISGGPMAVFLAGASLALAGFPGFVLVFYARQFTASPFYWIPEFGAATEFLALSVVIFVLLMRVWFWPTYAVLGELERDIVLGDVPLKEVKARFIRRVLGASVADWLGDLDKKFEQSGERIRELRAKFQNKLDEIEAIDARYDTERRERGKKALRELRSGLKECMDLRRGLITQIGQLLGHSFVSEPELSVLKRILDSWQQGEEKFMELLNLPELENAFDRIFGEDEPGSVR